MTGNQIRVERRNAAYWTARFAHPPISLIAPQTIGELDALVTQLESDPDETRQRLKLLVEAGLQQKGTVELDLSKYVGERIHD
jgi:hypothetical protein